MELSKYIACICEGAAEETIIKLLLDADRLQFTYDHLLEREVLRSRKAKKFEEQYHNLNFLSSFHIFESLGNSIYWKA